MGALLLIASGAAGAVLGVIFFGGLWLTVRHLNDKRQPATWMLLSLVLRFACALLGFFVLARVGGWQHVLAATGGFVLLRIVALHRTRADDASEAFKS